MLFIVLIVIPIRAGHLLNESPDPLTLPTPFPSPSECRRLPSVIPRGKVAGDNVEKDPQEGGERIDKEPNNEQQRSEDDVHETEYKSEDRRGDDPT